MVRGGWGWGRAWSDERETGFESCEREVEFGMATVKARFE
jgi:hypothetical protein